MTRPAGFEPLQTCLLCGGAPAVLGLFIPTEAGAQLRLRAARPDLRQPALFYVLCDACVADPTSAQRVEDRLLAYALEVSCG